MSSNEYWAGFFDGEGSVSISRDFHLHIRIGQKLSDVLFLAKEIFGGNIYTREHKIPYWCLFKASEVQNFLNAIYPFSIIKKRAIEIGLEFVSIVRKENKGYCELSIENRQKRLELREELMSLNGRKRPSGITNSIAEYRKSVKEKFDYKCCICEADLKSKSNFFVIVSGSNLYCRSCNAKRYNREIKPISKEEIIKAINTTKSLKEAAKKLNLAKSSFFQKRKKFNLV